jgi:hypothetical protein
MSNTTGRHRARPRGRPIEYKRSSLRLQCKYCDPTLFWWWFFTLYSPCYSIPTPHSCQTHYIYSSPIRLIIVKLPFVAVSQFCNTHLLLLPTGHHDPFVLESPSGNGRSKDDRDSPPLICVHIFPGKTTQLYHSYGQRRGRYRLSSKRSATPLSREVHSL